MSAAERHYPDTLYLFVDTLDFPVVITPIANHDDNQHGLNESVRLANLS